MSCEISGTPSILATTAVDYTVTGKNEGNPATVTTISIKVVAVPPTGLSFSPDAFTWTVGQAYQGFPTPTYSGDTVTSFTITPTLPDGLKFNGTNGTISGEPTTVQSTPATFTVTAGNSGGAASTTITVEVVATTPQGLAYDGKTAISYTIRTNNSLDVTPTWLDSGSISGGATLNYSITPALPTGLEFSTSSGRISGTTTDLTWPPVNYTVTAEDSGGASKAYVAIQVHFNT